MNFILSLLLLFYSLLLLFFPLKQPFFVELSLFNKFGWINLPINDKKGLIVKLLKVNDVIRKTKNLQKTEFQKPSVVIKLFRVDGWR
jgi:hypothetical protein